MKIAGIVLLILDVIVIVSSAVHGNFLSSSNDVFYSIGHYAFFAIPLILGIILLVIGIKKSKK